MGGITTGVGLFSGINTAELIEQLIALQSRPQVLAQIRMSELQTQQASLLDINSRLSAFKTAAADFRLNNVFGSKLATSSDETAMTATAGNSAIGGTYNFIIDRLVSTQQMLSRGFADQDSTAIGLSSLTFEGAEARLDRDTALADLNNSSGINRGTIVLNGEEIDLSTVGTVGELLDRINNSDAGVTASVRDGSFVLEGVTSLEDEAGSEVLASIGLDGAVTAMMTGTSVYGLGTNTSLAALNDGRGVGIREASGDVYDFEISIAGVSPSVKVRIGEIEEVVDGEVTIVAGAASTVGQVVDRINQALTDAGQTDVTASIDTANGRIVMTDAQGRSVTVSNITVGDSITTTATDLGIEGTFSGGSVVGRRVLAGMNSTLISSLNGGTGLGITDGLVTFDLSDGVSSYMVDVSDATTLDGLVRAINEGPGNPGVVAELNSAGTGLRITDTSGGSGDLVISGSAGMDAAAALGIDGVYADGVAEGSNLQLAYLGAASSLADLNNGDGIGLGEFEIVDSNSLSVTIEVTESDKTLDDIIRKINATDLAVTARINDTGDGLVIEEDSATPGGAKIRITDTEGTAARDLRIDGEATGVGADNFVDGSYETTVQFDAGATLEDIVEKINESDPGVSATIINDNAGANPYRLSIVSEFSGTEGRFVLDSGGFDLGLRSLDDGEDARIFYGSTDPADGVLISSSTNTVDGVIEGVSIDLKRASADPVSLSVTTDNESIEAKITAMVDAFNAVIDRIDFQTRYNTETKEKGALLGDGTVIALRNRMFSALRNPNDGFTDSFNRLTQVGLGLGEGGKLTFDSERFREAYAEDPQAVEAMFTRRDILEPDDDPDGDGIIVSDPDAPTEFSALGVIVQLEELANSYVTNIGGILQNRSDALDSQIAVQQSRIESMQKSLDNKRAMLERQFLAMEQAIAAFQSQGSALSQISLIG